MLDEVMAFCRNWFEDADNAKSDTFKVESGSIALDFVQDGQYFRIIGSVFNDGVYKYPECNLTDETFNGTIIPLKVPNDFISIVDEIETWQTKNGDVSPYASESFGGYSYSRGTAADGSVSSWQDSFKQRLRRWRKL